MKKSNNNGKVIQSGLANEGRNREGGPGGDFTIPTPFGDLASTSHAFL